MEYGFDEALFEVSCNVRTETARRRVYIPKECEKEVIVLSRPRKVLNVDMPIFIPYGDHPVVFSRNTNAAIQTSLIMMPWVLISSLYIALQSMIFTLQQSNSLCCYNHFYIHGISRKCN